MLILKFHPALRSGERLTTRGNTSPLFSRQGHWHGGSTLHRLAMALALLCLLGDPVWLPSHDHGNERTLRERAWPRYLNGLTLPELVDVIAGLQARPAPR